MRFTTAIAAFTASGLLPVVSSEFDDALNADLFQRPRQAIINPNGQAANYDTSSTKSLIQVYREKRRTNFPLKKRKRRITPKQECDPSADTSAKDVDVGLLACGYGMYCKESRYSSKGGLCEPTQESSATRLLQEGLVNITAVDLCDPNSYYYNLYECQCDEFDINTNTGTMQCVVYDNCLDIYGCDDICLEETFLYTRNLDGSYFYESCYDFNSPRNETACYAYDDMNYCSISFNDEVCDYCNFNETEYCTSFNCNNTAAMTYGNSCYGDSVAPLFDECNFTITPTCYVCEGGYVAYPYRITEIPYVGNYTCAEIAFNSQTLYNETCSFVQYYAAESCCSFYNGTIVPTEGDTTPPPVETAPPTQAPVTAAPATSPPTTAAPVETPTTESPESVPTTPTPEETDAPSMEPSAASTLSKTATIGMGASVTLLSLSFVATVLIAA